MESLQEVSGVGLRKSAVEVCRACKKPGVGLTRFQNSGCSGFVFRGLGVLLKRLKL